MTISSAARLHPRPRPISARNAELEGQVVTLSSLIRGCVARVLVVENQQVKKGDLLVELDHRELDRRIAALSTELDAAVLTSVHEEPATGDGPHLEGVTLSSASARSSAERARRRYLLACLRRLDADVVAPVDGRVVRVAVRPREDVAIAQPLVSILESDELWVVASFDNEPLEHIRTGQRAWVTARGVIFAARVDSIAHADGQVLLEFVASAVQPKAVLRPGASADVLVDT